MRDDQWHFTAPRVVEDVCSPPRVNLTACTIWLTIACDSMNSSKQHSFLRLTR